jgi:hypothetical protein
LASFVPAAWPTRAFPLSSIASRTGITHINFGHLMTPNRTSPPVSAPSPNSAIRDRNAPPASGAAVQKTTPLATIAMRAFVLTSLHASMPSATMTGATNSTPYRNRPGLCG